MFRCASGKLQPVERLSAILLDPTAETTVVKYASGLTMPEILWPLSPLTRDTTIELWYDAGPYPQVGWREV